MVHRRLVTELINRLADAFAATNGDVQRLVAAGAIILGKRRRWLRPLAQRIANTINFEDSARSIPPLRKLIKEFLKQDHGFRKACSNPEVLELFRVTKESKSETEPAGLDAVARALTSVFVRGAWTESDLIEGAARVVGGSPLWLRDLVGRLLSNVGEARRAHPAVVMNYLVQDALLADQCEDHGISLQLVLDRAAAMSPAKGNPSTWHVPALVSTTELASWLELKPAQLEWLADRKYLERHGSAAQLRNYRYFWLAKRVGGTARLIEAPKWKLKRVQQRILHQILERIPPHPAVHGYRPQRSVVSYAEQHTGQEVVIRLDLKDFFPTIRKSRVVALFHCAGYPPEVSQLLAALCTNSVPDEIWQTFPQYGGPFDRIHHEALYCRPHLPQGAPTSPALANLCCFRLDRRLAGLAESVAGTYTRYADDLLFSGGKLLSRSSRRFCDLVCAIALEEGFQLNTRKLRIMKAGVRQHAVGLVLNACLNVPRHEYDQLKALLHNCKRYGPQSQNRAEVPNFRAYLHGKIGYIETIHKGRGAHLRAMFEQIDWAN